MNKREKFEKFLESLKCGCENGDDALIESLQKVS
ncbi:unnamed protein product, partial [marine sediment metagenome]